MVSSAPVPARVSRAVVPPRLQFSFGSVGGSGVGLTGVGGEPGSELRREGGDGSLMSCCSLNLTVHEHSLLLFFSLRLPRCHVSLSSVQSRRGEARACVCACVELCFHPADVPCRLSLIHFQ